MTSQPQPTLTAQEYLARERAAAYKSEYLRGEVFAMAGASERHNLIVANLIAALHPQLKERPCKVYASDMRLKVSPTGLYTYPDVTVVCGPAAFDDEQRDTLLNPTVLIEVLSPATADYDRGGKFAHYRKLASLQAYLLIAQDEPLIEHYTRQTEAFWLFAETAGLAAGVDVPAIECRLALADVYAKTEPGDQSPG